MAAKNPFGKRRRGSVLIYTSVIMVAITTVVIGTVQLNVTAGQKAQRRIDDAQAEATFEAQVAEIIDKCKNNAITLPLTFSTTLNGQTLSCTVSDNDGTMSHSYKVEATGSGGFNRRFVKYIGGRQKSHPLFFGFYINSSYTTGGVGLSTTGNGSVYINGSATLDPSCSIAGDAVSFGTLNVNGGAVSRNVVPSVGSSGQVEFPAIDANALRAEATTLSSALTLPSLSFLALLVNGHYALHYYDQPVSMSGLVTGKGTAVFAGNVTVTGNVQYLNGTARAVYIVNGDLIINSGVTRLDGIWYVKGAVVATGSTTTLSNTRGAVAANWGINTTRPMNLAYDAGIWNARLEGPRHCIPGFWPTADGSLMR